MLRASHSGMPAEATHWCNISQRKSLVERYVAVRAATEELAEPLSGEDQCLQSMPSCSPTKWHRAHTTWFFETFVLAPRGLPVVNDAWGYLFNSYYQAIGPRHERPKRGMLSRPSLAEVGGYRHTVDGRVIELLQSTTNEELTQLRPLIELGLAHEQQHQELILTDILNAFWENPLKPVYRPMSIAPSGPVPPLSFVEFEPGLARNRCG